ncbi:G2/M phase checkpoint control protein [Pseudozyma hubeiensis]|nr:G2/M phase checkpoint control protein [Pseudozyma hubeiensis]
MCILTSDLTALQLALHLLLYLLSLTLGPCPRVLSLLLDPPHIRRTILAPLLHSIRNQPCGTAQPRAPQQPINQPDPPEQHRRQHQCTDDAADQMQIVLPHPTSVQPETASFCG